MAPSAARSLVRPAGAGQITVGCYLYDVGAGRELVRQGYQVTTNNWRRAANKCADAIYSRLTGEGAYFDTRIVYVSETGPARRVRFYLRSEICTVFENASPTLSVVTPGNDTFNADI